MPMSRTILPSLRPSRRVSIIGYLMILVILGGGVAGMWVRHRSEVRNARRETANLALVLAEETSRSFQSVDLVLAGVAEKVLAAGIRTPEQYLADMRTPEMHEMLKERIAALPQLKAISMIEADGTLINFSRRWPIPAINVADRDYFRALVANPSVSHFVSEPVLNRGTGTWTIYLAHRLAGPDGRFIGLVLGAMELGYFDELYHAIALGDEGSIALIRQSDGKLLVRYPRAAAAIGKSFKESELLRALGKQDSATVEAASAVDGLARVLSAHTVPHFPLAVIVTRSKQGILDSWINEAVILGIIVILIAEAFFIALVLLVGQMKRGESFEAAQAASEARYRSVVGNLKEVVFQTDVEGRWQFLNPAWTEITGFAVEDSLGRMFLDYVHPDDRAVNAEKFRPLITREKAYCRHEIRYLTKDDGFRWIEVFARLVVAEDGVTIVGTAGTLNDVTERHAAAEALKQSEARLVEKTQFLEATLENIDQGILMVDADGTVPVCNRRAVDLLDLPPDLMALRPSLADVVAHQRRMHEFDKVDEAFLSLAQSGALKERSHIYERRRPNGRVVEIHSLSLQGGGMVRTYTDVTERLEVERQLRAAKEEAEAASHARAAFLATMSHEIRTPLNGVIGLAGLLMDTPLGTEQRRYVHTLRESADHLLQIISDVLDVSKLDAGKMALEETPFNLEELIQGTISMLNPRAIAKGLDLRVTIGDGVPRRLVGDAGRLRQILLNLVGNAIKFTDAGWVTIGVARKPGGGGAAGRIALAFEVRDTGIGIAPESLPKLFSEFHQVDGSITRRFGGTGLGLAICQRLVTAMAGSIGVESEPGRGSVFRFDVELGETANSGDAKTTTEADAAALPDLGRPLRVLLAEDNRTNQLVAAAMLEKMGCRVDVAANGHEVVRAVQDRQYDVVLMDIMMPEMDGFAATKAIRSMPGSQRGVPIVALTANAFAHDREACMAAGMSGFISKPVTTGKLAAAIGTALGNAAAAHADPVADKPESADAPFDDSAIDELRQTYGGALPRFAELFLTESDARLSRIEALLDTDDTAAIQIEAHTLKGAAMTFGCQVLRTAAAKLEAAAAAARSAAELRTQYADLAQAFAEVRGGLLARVTRAA